MLPSKKYTKKHGYDSLAMTISYKRRIDFHAEGVDKETLVHELTHAWLYEMCYKSTNNIDVEDLEEIFAELMSKWGRELLDLADAIKEEIKNKQKIILTNKKSSGILPV